MSAYTKVLRVGDEAEQRVRMTSVVTYYPPPPPTEVWPLVVLLVGAAIAWGTQ